MKKIRWIIQDEFQMGIQFQSDSISQSAMVVPSFFASIANSRSTKKEKETFVENGFFPLFCLGFFGFPFQSSQILTTWTDFRGVSWHHSIHPHSIDILLAVAVERKVETQRVLLVVAVNKHARNNGKILWFISMNLFVVSQALGSTTHEKTPVRWISLLRESSSRRSSVTKP